MSSSRSYSDRLSAIDDELRQISQDIKALRSRQRKLDEEKLKIEAALDQNASPQDEEFWEKPNPKWTEKFQQLLKTTFGYDKFRPLQQSAINAVVSGEDVLLIMSTGGGKSLCYQFPALFLEGLTLVVCPLISLMEDQVMSFEKFAGPGVARMLNASTSKEELNSIQTQMTDPNGKMRLLYVTPEKIAKSKRFMAKLEKTYEAGRLKLIAIDEVHCCSQWGHDFRPDYKFLNVMRRQFSKVPILGLTATAAGTVLTDVKEMLGIAGALVFRSGFNRPNLFFQVRLKPPVKEEFLADLVKVIKNQFHNQSGIIYCFSRKESEDLAQKLCEKGIKARWYHADMEAATRSKVHEKWISNKCQVIVATVAFGMGIDKPDVRFVIHHSMAKSMENYYQESGRAGRDGLPATCLLYYGFADIARQSTMVCVEKTGLENLYPMISYALNVKECRRSLMARNFFEDWEDTWCQGQCDVCKTPGSHSSIDIVSKDVKERIVARLLIEGYLKEDFHFTPYSIICYVIPGYKADALLSSVTIPTTLTLEVPSKNSKPKLELKRKNAEPLDCQHVSASTSFSVDRKKEAKIIDEDEVIIL